MCLCISKLEFENQQDSAGIDRAFFVFLFPFSFFLFQKYKNAGIKEFEKKKAGAGGAVAGGHEDDGEGGDEGGDDDGSEVRSSTTINSKIPVQIYEPV